MDYFSQCSGKDLVNKTIKSFMFEGLVYGSFLLVPHICFAGHTCWADSFSIPNKNNISSNTFSSVT